MSCDRIAYEKKVVGQMIRLYCRRYEGNPTLCDGCRELLQYASERLEHCPQGNAKPSCRRCKIHCYKPTVREKMRQVMRYAGPRMLWYHPWDAIRHLFA